MSARKTIVPAARIRGIRARFDFLLRGLAGALAMLSLSLATGLICLNQARAANECHASALPEEQGMHLPARGVIVPLEQIKEICLRFGLDALWEKIAKDPPEQPFKSDGCSLWFNKWQGYDLYPACFRHDLKYWAGYPGEEVERLVADSELMIEVARIMGSIEMAETMFTGVRVGGGAWTRASFAWGYGRKTEDRRRRTEDRRQYPDTCLLSPVPCSVFLLTSGQEIYKSLCLSPWRQAPGLSPRPSKNSWE